MLNEARFTCNFMVLSITSVRESQLTKYLALRPSISKVKTLLSLSTTGRTFRLWGDIGVITKLPDRGKTIGPPQLIE